MIIRTVFSTYLLDRDAMTAVRTTETDGALRRDGEPIPLLRWPKPAVGEELYLLLKIREADGVQTVRRTSFVLAVEE